MADNLRTRSEGSALPVPRCHAGNAPSPGESGKEKTVGATAKDSEERAALLARIAAGDEDVDVGIVVDSGLGRWDIVYGADVPVHKVRQLEEGRVSLSRRSGRHGRVSKDAVRGRAPRSLQPNLPSHSLPPSY